MEAFKDSIVDAKATKDQLLGLYYLISWKDNLDYEIT